ncbi:hypothetical protein RHMOL_Rhmol04G0252700 [Rhododendron molle]|uniref:Uncharacterized protein n=1 Tax=Rhododendron molle TaxID=49168 RepID=A0ACC0P5I1_RHOML|nr:hypothetical protein RHMOL_Rhmol04G0252700 [Rhododendron molle]
MHATEFNENGTRPNKTSHVVEIDGMDPRIREHIIDRIIDMADPSRSTVRPPSYNTEHRGRPVGKDEQSTHRIPSFLEASTSRSRTATSRVRGRGRRGRVRGFRFHPFLIATFSDYLRLISVIFLTQLMCLVMVIMDSGR